MQKAYARLPILLFRKSDLECMSTYSGIHTDKIIEELLTMLCIMRRDFYSLEQRCSDLII